jgi:hypothetical protein
MRHIHIHCCCIPTQREREREYIEKKEEIPALPLFINIKSANPCTPTFLLFVFSTRLSAEKCFDLAAKAEDALVGAKFHPQCHREKSAADSDMR